MFSGTFYGLYLYYNKLVLCAIIITREETFSFMTLALLNDIKDTYLFNEVFLVRRKKSDT